MTPARYFKKDWIVSPLWDLSFFTGSVLVSFLFLKFFLYLDVIYSQYSEIVCIIIFYSIFDYPHIFQTFSRTHKDKIEFSRRKIFYTWGLFFLLVLGFAIKFFDKGGYFIEFLSLYGIWHILKQNIGFLRLYQERSKNSREMKIFEISIFYFLTISLIFYRVFVSKTFTPTFLPSHYLIEPVLLFGVGAGFMIWILLQFVELARGTFQFPRFVFF